jgi:hypothetical protein
MNPVTSDRLSPRTAWVTVALVVLAGAVGVASAVASAPTDGIAMASGALGASAAGADAVVAGFFAPRPARFGVLPAEVPTDALSVPVSSVSAMTTDTKSASVSSAAGAF